VLGFLRGSSPASTSKPTQPNSRATFFDEYDGGLPDKFALVETTGLPKARARDDAKECDGIRKAAEPFFKTFSASLPGFAGTTRVNGPGMNSRINFLARGLNSKYFSAISLLETIITNGLPAGLFLAANTLRTASLFVASAPRP